MAYVIITISYLLQYLTGCRILEPHRGWNYAEEMRDAFGEAFLIVSPGQIYMNISNPGSIIQMTTRRNDFLKPVEIYGVVDIFGSSMLSTEGTTGNDIAELWHPLSLKRAIR